MSRLSAEQTEAWRVHIEGLLSGHPEQGHRERDENGTWQWIVDCEAWAGVWVELRDLQRRGRDELVDGYPRSSMGGGSPSNEVDDDGVPIPPRSDPTGAAVIARAAPNVIDRTFNEALEAVVALGRNAERAKSLLMRLKKPPEAPAQTEKLWCAWHTKHGMTEPINSHGRAGDCQFCTEFRHAYKAKPPKRILEARARGERITQAKIDDALGRKRKAS